MSEITLKYRKSENCGGTYSADLAQAHAVLRAHVLEGGSQRPRERTIGRNTQGILLRIVQKHKDFKQRT